MRILCNNRAGIALLEVLVSVSVIAAGMGVALFAIRGVVHQQARIDTLHVAERLAEGQLAQLRASGASALENEMGGKFAAPHDAYSWTATVDPPTEEAPFAHVSLIVWRGSSDERTSVFQTQTLVR